MMPISSYRVITMQILFVADPLESFVIYKDSTFAMMREAQRRGHQIVACEPKHISWQSGGKVKALVRYISLTGNKEAWFDETASKAVNLADFGAIVMRKDPPFDSEFFYATHMLSQAEREGAKVFNKPSALREHPKSSPSWSLRSSSHPPWLRAAPGHPCVP